jgi:hypothetical protein
MSRAESFEALRRANPRHTAAFAEAVDAAVAEVRARIETDFDADRLRVHTVRPRRHFVGVSVAGVALAAAAAVTVFLTIGSLGVTPGVEEAAAAMTKAARLTAASADQSGSATVRMTHDGQIWAQKTVRWNGDDLEISDESPRGPSSGLPLLVVDGIMYGHDPGHEGWVEVGPVSSSDPGTGTTPADILSAVREDMGGATLRRITGAMTAGGLTTHRSDGSTVYSGKVAAGQIARETGFKEGRSIRVFPFGYVAHDAAADTASLLDTAVTVGADDVIREIAVTWGTWIYTVTYSGLGSTPAPVAPANATSLREERMTTTPTP